MSRQTFVLAFILTLAAFPAVAWEGQGSQSCSPYRRDTFGRGYDPFDDGTEAWYAPNVGSWSDHADAYYGYDDRRFAEPNLD